MNNNWISVQDESQICKMTCEHFGCTETIGNDYKRKVEIEGWEGEPIFLCGKHSEGFELISPQFHDQETINGLDNWVN